MPTIEKEELRDLIKRHESCPVFLLHGAETYLRDIAARTIVDRAFSGGDFRDFNETTFSLNNPGGLNAGLGAARQLPMMSQRRVVVITDVRISATGFRDTIKEEHEPILDEYLDNPTGTTVLILIADDLNGNRKMSKLLKEKCLSVEFKRLEEPELLRWTRNKLAEDGAAADESTVRHLVHLAGPDLRRLKIEIEKLVTASMPEKVITLPMVDDLVPHTRELDNWLLTDEMIAGRKANAIRLARKLMDDGAEPLAILGLIGSNFRRLLTAKELMARGVNRNEVSRVSKAPYKSQEQFFAFARRTPSRSFADALVRISDADVAIKNSIGGSGPAGARVQLEMLICELALL